MELNHLAERPSVYSASRLPRTNPEPRNEKSRLGYPGGFLAEKSAENAPLATQTFRFHGEQHRNDSEMCAALPTIAIATLEHLRVFGVTQHDPRTLNPLR